MFWYASFAALVWSLSVHPGAVDLAGAQLRQAVAGAPDAVASVCETMAQRPDAPAQVVPADEVVQWAEACPPACPAQTPAGELPPAAREEGMIWGETDEGEVGAEEAGPPPEVPIVAEAPEPAWEEPVLWWQGECRPDFGRIEAPAMEAGSAPADAPGDPLVEHLLGLVADAAGTLNRALAGVRSFRPHPLLEHPPGMWRFMD